MAVLLNRLLLTFHELLIQESSLPYWPSSQTLAGLTKFSVQTSILLLLFKQFRKQCSDPFIGFQRCPYQALISFGNIKKSISKFCIIFEIEKHNVQLFYHVQLVLFFSMSNYSNECRQQVGIKSVWSFCLKRSSWLVNTMSSTPMVYLNLSAAFNWVCIIYFRCDLT